MMISLKKKNKKASVLIFTLFIMMISLIAGISIISVTNSDMQSSFSTAKSVNSLQVADAGLDMALNSIKSPPPTVTNIEQITLFNNCSSGEVARDLPPSGYGSYTLTFYDNTDTQLQCNDLISDIKTIKSVGSYKGTSRAVEVTLP